MSIFNISRKTLSLIPFVVSTAFLHADVLSDFDSIIKITQPSVRVSAIEGLLAKIEATDLDLLLTSIESVEDTVIKEELLKAAAHYLAREDGSRAVELLFKNGINPKDLTRTLRLWSIRQPELAMNWLEQNRQYMADEYDDAFLKVFTSWSISDAKKATVYAYQIKNEFTQRCGFAYCYIPQVLRPDVSKVDLLKTVEESDLSDLQKIEVKAILLSLWIQRDPSGVLTWMNSNVKDEKEKESLFTTILVSWGRSDAAGAGEWVTEHSQDLAANSYYAAYAEGICSATPESALAWATAMSEKEFREQTILKLLLKWAESDKGAARKWLKNNTLFSDEMNVSFMRQVRDHRVDETTKDRIIGFGPLSVVISR